MTKKQKKVIGSPSKTKPQTQGKNKVNNNRYRAVLGEVNYEK